MNNKLGLKQWKWVSNMVEDDVAKKLFAVFRKLVNYTYNLKMRAWMHVWEKMSEY